MPFDLFAPNYFYLAFQSFDFGCTW